MSSKTRTDNSGFLKSTWQTIAVPLGAILLALLIGALIVLVSGANPIRAYAALLQGAFGNVAAVSRTLEKATPLIFNGIAITLAFKAGMFNIGAQGQLLFGAIVAAFVGFTFRGLPWFVHGPVAILCGAVAGGLFGSIPGMLKAGTGASEVITTIMLNYVAINLTDWLVGGPWQDRSTEILLPRTPQIAESAFINKGRLIDSGIIFVVLAVYVIVVSVIFVNRYLKFRQKNGNSCARFISAVRSDLLLALVPVILIGLYIMRLLQVGFILAVGAAFFIWWLLERTTLGFEIRMVGSNSNAARYAGVNVALIVVLTMVISGILAGMGGAVETTGVDGRFEPGFNIGLGFDGITIALLGKVHPLGSIPAAILIGAMKAGSSAMQFNADVPKEIIDVVQALMLFFVAADIFVRHLLRIRQAEDKISLTSGWGQH